MKKVAKIISIQGCALKEGDLLFEVQMHPGRFVPTWGCFFLIKKTHSDNWKTNKWKIWTTKKTFSELNFSTDNWWKVIRIIEEE